MRTDLSTIPKIRNNIWDVQSILSNFRRRGCDVTRLDSIIDILGEQDHTMIHVPLYGGEIWYVDGVNGNDANEGHTPHEAFATIGQGIATMMDGDALNVRAATYVEVGLDLNHDAAEIWFEIGAIIDPPAGVALTISGDFCKLKGEHNILPAAGQTGLLISGDECVVCDSKVLFGAIGIQITGAGVILNRCAVGFQTNTAYDIQGIQGRLYRCKTVGNAATYGYRIRNGVDTGVLEFCTSAGHQTSGFYIDTGSQDWTLLNCSSGAEDGKWRDIDHANVWSNFSYDETQHSEITFAGIPTTYNIFQITGAVRISNIFGVVTTPIAAVASTIYLQLFSTGGTVDITDAPGVDINAVVAGGILVRNGPSTDTLDLADPNGTPVMAENVAWKDPKTAIDIVEDNGADTFVRLVLSAALASGVIDWHCEWEPLSDDGFLEPV